MNSPVRTLYAEDNAQDADLTRSWFAEAAPEFDLHVVETGRDCLERLAMGGWDLLMLDHHLPDMDGLDVLRSLARSRASIPAVLVTGTGDEALVVKALRLGASNYVVKEGDYLQTLPALLRTVMSDHRVKVREGLLSNVTKRVLYLEHNEMDIELTVRHFEEVAPWFELEVSRSSPEALARLARAPSLDAALIDLRMPGQNGLDFVREAHRLSLPLPPFIMISGQGDEATALASLKLGAADYVNKREGYLDQLVSTVERSIAHHRADLLNTRLEAELVERARIEEEDRKLRASAAQADRLATMGMLAAGIAHEINNPLMYVLHNLESLLTAMPQETRARQALEGTRKIKDIVRALSTFSRVETDSVKPVHLRTPIESALNIAFNEIKYRARLVKDFGNTSAVLASEGRLSQVFLNLLVNAAHAIPEGDVENNSICVRTWQEGDEVCASVEDTGCGIPKENLERIFEPFFTTKPVGIGSGLGLNIARNIISGCGGTITVSSELQKGTRFVIRLPATRQERRSDPAAPSGAQSGGASGRVLVIDDDAEIRAVLSRTLGCHEVVLAASGQEACTLLAKDQSFDAILCDVMMPNVSGIDLHRWMVKHNLALADRVIFTTGGAFTREARQYLEQVPNRTLEKPLDVRALEKLLAQMVEAARAPADR